MNQYITNLNRIEFVVTRACTGRCKHCSEGEHVDFGERLDAGAAAQVVHDIAEKYHIASLMTFGGEPLLFPVGIGNTPAPMKKIPRISVPYALTLRGMCWAGIFIRRIFWRYWRIMCRIFREMISGS